MSGFLLCDPTWERTGGARGMGFFVWRIVPVHAFSYGLQYIRRPVVRVKQADAPFLPKTGQLII